VNKVFEISLIVLFLAVSSCKKTPYKQYEEDPEESSLSPNQRARGDWFLDDFTFRGTSIVTDFNKVFQNKIDIRSARISVVFDDYKKENLISISTPRVRVSEVTFDETNFFFPPVGIEDSSINMSFFSPMHFKLNLDPFVSWKVTKLFDKELRLVFATDTGEYKMMFSKK
jgi:hypothetical protein